MKLTKTTTIFDQFKSFLLYHSKRKDYKIIQRRKQYINPIPIPISRKFSIVLKTSPIIHSFKKEVLVNNYKIYLINKSEWKEKWLVQNRTSAAGNRKAMSLELHKCYKQHHAE